MTRQTASVALLQLNPFKNPLTKAELGPVLADSVAFRDYVTAHHLEPAFFDIEDNLVYDELTVDEFYDILSSIFDKTGRLIEPTTTPLSS